MHFLVTVHSFPPQSPFLPFMLSATSTIYYSQHPCHLSYLLIAAISFTRLHRYVHVNTRIRVLIPTLLLLRLSPLHRHSIPHSSIIIHIPLDYLYFTNLCHLFSFLFYQIVTFSSSKLRLQSLSLIQLHPISGVPTKPYYSMIFVTTYLTDSLWIFPFDSLSFSQLHKPRFILSTWDLDQTWNSATILAPFPTQPQSSMYPFKIVQNPIPNLKMLKQIMICTQHDICNLNSATARWFARSKSPTCTINFSLTSSRSFIIISLLFSCAKPSPVTVVVDHEVSFISCDHQWFGLGRIASGSPSIFPPHNIIANPDNTKPYILSHSTVISNSWFNIFHKFHSSSAEFKVTVVLLSIITV